LRENDVNLAEGAGWVNAHWGDGENGHVMLIGMSFIVLPFEFRYPLTKFELVF